jgi:hypothetical protein
MNNDRIWEIARKRAGYALAKIANNQMSTWRPAPVESAADIIAEQIREAMNDALTDERNI